ncbi:FixH family protein [Sphingomonas sp. LHG3406-1]|uniref:FixH family protein n=1 Tax=Sphingomonas sp. LHG3406-1 TaxID=2804617 RepID=UPI0026114586|nr:FixH family protein [Sphingomonas sp. LHG3406-1]
MIARRFTGLHMTALLCGFFAVVIAVNLLMASFAVRTFGGVVVENSYVASQKYNDWLAEAERQAKLGWSVKADIAQDRRVLLATSVEGAGASAIASHPLGRQPDVSLRFHREGGKLVSDMPLPAGRWDVRVTVRSGADQLQIIETLS